MCVSIPTSKEAGKKEEKHHALIAAARTSATINVRAGHRCGKLAVPPRVCTRAVGYTCFTGRGCVHVPPRGDQHCPCPSEAVSLELVSFAAVHTPVCLSSGRARVRQPQQLRASRAEVRVMRAQRCFSVRTLSLLLAVVSSRFYGGRAGMGLDFSG